MKLGRLFDQIPFEILARQLAKDSDFISDMKALLNIERSRFDLLLSEMAAFDGFLDEEQLKRITSEVLEDTKDEIEIADTISRLSSVIFDTDTPPSKAVAILSDSIKEQEEEFTSEDKEEIAERIKELTVLQKGIAKQHKAKSLRTALLGHLEDFKIYCDIRPIFNEDREAVDGAIPISSIKLEYVGSDGEPEVVEFRINKEKLELIEEAVVSAKRKLEVIHELLNKYDVQVPNMNPQDSKEGK